MGDFETGLIIESQVAKRPPVFFHHARGRGAEFFGESAERAIARGKIRDLAPAFLLDRFD